MKNEKGLEQIQPEETPPAVPDYVNDAFDAMFDVGDNATMEQRFDALLQAIVTYRFYLLDRHRRTGKKRLDAEDVFLFDCNEQLKHIEKAFAIAKKHGRIANIPNDQWDTQLLIKIRNKKGSIANIVQNLPPAL